ncbi:heme-binding domain-containing protein [Flavobacteriaceae bacterium LMO-SS05]
MKFIKITLILLVLIFVGIQCVPTMLNQSDEVPKTDFLSLYKAPKPIESKIKVSCYDCHSNNTQYPWYSKIQPGAWFMENHIKEGKEELNFSVWGNYSDRRKKSKLKSIINQIKDDEMPLSSYTLIHGDAKLSRNEKTEIINWLTHLRDSI